MGAPQGLPSCCPVQASGTFQKEQCRAKGLSKGGWHRWALGFWPAESPDGWLSGWFCCSLSTWRVQGRAQPLVCITRVMFCDFLGMAPVTVITGQLGEPGVGAHSQGVAGQGLYPNPRTPEHVRLPIWAPLVPQTSPFPMGSQQGPASHPQGCCLLSALHEPCLFLLSWAAQGKDTLPRPHPAPLRQSPAGAA